MAEISMIALEKAATLADLGKQVGVVAGRLVKTLKGTSRSSGYSKEPAKFHRCRHWALCDYFGLPQYFSQSHRVTSASFVSACSQMLTINIFAEVG